MAGVILSPNSVSVTPGGEAVCTVTIRNASAVVDSYEVSVLGDAAAWATVTPASVSLFPGADGTAEIRFRPPRNASMRAGAVDFAVRVGSTQSPDDSVVEEGVATIEPFTEIAARITPRTSEAKRKAKHVVAIDNKGNAPVTVGVHAVDPDEALAFQATPPEVTIEPGETGAISIGVASRKGHARGPAQHRPFQAFVTPSPAGMQPPITLDANFVQKAGMPSFIPVIAAAAVILIAAAIIVPGLTKGGDKGGTFSLTGAAGATSTTVAAAAVEGGEDGAEAEAEVAEGAGGEAAGEDAGGKTDDAGAGGGGSTATTVASSGGGTKPAVTTTVAPNDDETTATTAQSAAPVASTSTVAPTTTAAPTTTTAPPWRQFVGTWQSSAGCVSISAAEPSVTVNGTVNGLSVSGAGSTSDANDLDFISKARRGAQDRFRLSSGSLFVTLNYDPFVKQGSIQFTRVKACV